MYYFHQKKFNNNNNLIENFIIFVNFTISYDILQFLSFFFFFFNLGFICGGCGGRLRVLALLD